MPHTITTELLSTALSFDGYMALTKGIVAESIPRTGIYTNDSTFRYTRSNLERMEKVLNNIVINQKLYNQLSELKDDWIWLVISEPWCGDASWGTAALHILATATDNINLRILLRDEHPEIIKQYQTAGSDSIPKLVCLRKSDLTVLGTWGPRPQVLQQMVTQWKDAPGSEYKERVRLLHAWYDEDMTRSIQDEFIDLIKEWKNK